MGKRVPHPSEGNASYWEKRIRSPAFRHELMALLHREITALADARVKDVLDADLVRRTIREWDAGLTRPDVIADFVIQANRHVAGRLKRRRQSVLGLLDEPLVARLDALLEEDMELSAHAEQFIAKLMRQEFVHRLFTDIIFTSIVSFYEKVNPFFGALAMRALEEQIKSFIRLFMPMVEAQATEFAVNRNNQRFLLDFTRAIVWQLLNEPLPWYGAMISSGQRKKAAALIRAAIGNAKLDTLARDTALAVWDDLYKTMQKKKVGDLLRIAERADWLAERCVEVILPALARPGIVQFIAREIALAP